MIRIFIFLMICTLAYSCTSTEPDTTISTIVEDQLESSTADIEDEVKETEEEETEEVQEVQTAKTQIGETLVVSEKKVVETQKSNNSQKSYSSSIVAVGSIAVNTVFMSEEEVAQFNEIDNRNLASVEYELPSADDVAALRQLMDDLIDEVEGFASIEDTATETTVRVGAFDEVIRVTKSGEDITEETMFKEANSVDKKSLEYIRRPKPLVEYSGYKIELMTVYNKSLDLNDPLFKTFGGLTFKNNTLTSITYYLGDFKDTTALEDYLQKVVKTRFPKARGVKFENGLEVKY